jgi:hypothetical protein
MKIRIGLASAFVLLSLAACRSDRASHSTGDKQQASGASLAKDLSQSGHVLPSTKQDAQPRRTPKEGSLLVNKPYFTLRVQGNSLPYSVYVNGAPVTADYTWGVSDETWPINQFMRGMGDNEVSVVVLAGELDSGAWGIDPEGDITLTLLVQNASDLRQPGVTVGTLRFQGKLAGSAQATEGSSPHGRLDSSRRFEPEAAGDVVASPVQVKSASSRGALHISRSFDMLLPFPEWEFLRSDRVTPCFEVEMTPEAQKLHEQLLNAYEEIWKAFQARDVDRVLGFYEERSRNTDAAYYLPSGTTHARLKTAIEEAFEDRSHELGRIRTDDGWLLDIGPSGQLMRLVQGNHASAILRFAPKQQPGLRTVFATTFRKKGDRFVVAL